MLINHIRRTTNRYSHVKDFLGKAKALAVLRQLNQVAPQEHAVRSPLANALQLLPQPFNINQALYSVLMHLDMLVQMAVINQPVELRPGLISEEPRSLANRH